VGILNSLPSRGTPGLPPGRCIPSNGSGTMIARGKYPHRLSPFRMPALGTLPAPPLCRRLCICRIHAALSPGSVAMPKRNANKNIKIIRVDSVMQPQSIPLNATQFRAELSPGRLFYAASEHASRQPRSKIAGSFPFSDYWFRNPARIGGILGSCSKT
jgi:hypothetical protein